MSGNCVHTLEHFVIVKPTIFRCYQNSSNFLLNLCKLMFIALNCLCASFHCMFFQDLDMAQASELNEKVIFFIDDEEILHFHACRFRHTRVRRRTYSTCLEKLNCRCHSCCMHNLHISLHQKQKQPHCYGWLCRFQFTLSIFHTNPLFTFNWYYVHRTCLNWIFVWN